ncbi:bacteriochlorophyll 4-vinyl reductase [bacterium]|nr:bacteriochlorophyll 4-vinyl reductase [bacterium]
MDGGHPDLARIGPNAILQLVPVLDRALGPRARGGLFVQAGVVLPPPDAGMLPEAEVTALHRALWFWLPTLAPGLLRDAGLATGDYILAHRIPALAQRAIRPMPAPLAARILAGAIARHAWTFAGSGRFTVESFRPLTFAIAANPMATGPARGVSCHWHAAVFERLFSALVWPRVRVVETACCAAGDPACRFEIRCEIRA